MAAATIRQAGGSDAAPGAGRRGYRQIAADLIEELHAGAWQTGDKLPTEQALVERFGVSRNTVRDALRELSDRGYLGKRRGTPSVVQRTTPDRGFVNSITSVSQLLEYAAGAHNTLLSAETLILLEEQARQLDCPPRSEWLRLQLLRRREAGDRPFCYSEVFVAPRYAAVVDQLGDESVYSAIERVYGVATTRVVQVVGAAAADPAVALRLEVPTGSPILLARSTFHAADGSVVEVGMARFAPDRYSLRMALDRRSDRAGPPELVTRPPAGGSPC